MQTSCLQRNTFHIKHGMCDILKRKIAGGPRVSGGSPNAQTANICCGLFGTGFHSSDSSQYFERSAIPFANNFGGSGEGYRLPTLLVDGVNA
jgi:hypothetical protein